MGCMLRSDPMTFCDIYLQPEAAFEILSELGELGRVQFNDMTPETNAFHRNYISEVCRCAELQRKLEYMHQEMLKDNIYISPLREEPGAMQPNEINVYENVLEKWEDDIIEMSRYQSQLVKNHQQLLEMDYVLKHIGPILGDVELRRESIFKAGGGDLGAGGRLVVVTGVVKRKRSFPFEMMLWRVSRGNIYYRQAAEDQFFEHPVNGTQILKVAFLLICQGRELNVRMQKVCSGFHVKLYSCPRTHEDRMEMIDKVETRLSDLDQVLKKTNYHRCKALRTVGRQWLKWNVQVKKAKAIYHVMNLFNLDVTKKCLLGQCWLPDQELNQVQKILDVCSERIGSNVPSFISKTGSTEVPPTFHRTNKFTDGFQALINAYGVSTYREINPGLYTIITFPFLFAVMFGDAGHGIIILSFAIWMLYNEKHILAQRSTNEIWNILFGGRYIIFLMGLFTLCTGFVYNDWFSKPMVLQNPYWLNTYSINKINQAPDKALSLDPALKTMKPYVFGVDPTWTFATNKIMSDNSLKMKLSIIIGVIHMMFGIWISLFNHIYFKRHYAIFLEFLPQLLFLSCLFLWLVFLIFFKWFAYSAKDTELKKKPGCAPLVLILFIDMALMRTTKAVDPNCDAYMFSNQKNIQRGMLIMALISIPLLLFGMPVYLHVVNKREEKRREVDEDLEAQDVSELPEAAKKSESFGELMIHQGVHTIEFVLSTISHTASYLRLWALSLAHAQLSEMLWQMVLSKLALQTYTLVGAPKVFIVFGIWAIFSLCILVVMEGLSAFLHTLRLHWVEFMSKFYMGGGEAFSPFSFSILLYGDNKEDKKGEGACKHAKKDI